MGSAHGQGLLAGHWLTGKVSQRQSHRLGLGVDAVAVHDCSNIVVLEFDVGPRASHTRTIHVRCTTSVGRMWAELADIRRTWARVAGCYGILADPVRHHPLSIAGRDRGRAMWAPASGRTKVATGSGCSLPWARSLLDVCPSGGRGVMEVIRVYSDPGHDLVVEL